MKKKMKKRKQTKKKIRKKIKKKIPKIKLKKRKVLIVSKKKNKEILSLRKAVKIKFRPFIKAYDSFREKRAIKRLKGEKEKLIEKGKKLKKKQVCLTFDDSLKCQFDLALPVIEELNIKSFFSLRKEFNKLPSSFFYFNGAAKNYKTLIIDRLLHIYGGKKVYIRDLGSFAEISEVVLLNWTTKRSFSP